jgi:hypothetical protein
MITIFDRKLIRVLAFSARMGGQFKVSGSPIGRWPLLAAAVLGLSASLLAQFNQAKLGGSVSDSSGAPIPDAKVTARNTGTGLTRIVLTGQDGAFVVPSLPIGGYTVTIEKPGFTTQVREGLVLTVDQVATVTVVLPLGGVTQQVTVSANAELVTSQEAAVGQLIDQRRVVELPLNGRHAQDLVFLSAGTSDLTSRYCGFNCFGGVYPGEQRASINGNSAGGVFYTLDGSSHNDSYLSMNLPFPNPDAVEEFRLQENNLSAIYGSSGSGVVNIVTKSGTNSVHGSLFEFLRNGDLNARNFFAPKHDTLKRNQFGGSVGGPILKDKLFYFASYQGTRTTSAPSGAIAFVPTQAERNGNFSAVATQLIDPETGTPFQGNQIPASRLSAPAQFFLSKMPLPNGPGGQLTYAGAPARPFEDEGTAKIDYLRGNQHWSGRYYATDFRQPAVAAPANNIIAADGQGNRVRVQSLSGDYLNTLSPTVLIEGNFGYNRQRGGSLSSAPFSFADAGVQIAPASLAPGELVVTAGGAFTVNTGHPGIFNRDDYNMRGMMTVVRGHHELRLGMDATRLQNQIQNTFTQAGSFTFSSRLSGDNLADFVLGDAGNFRQGGGEFKDLAGWRWGWFLQDNWHLNSRLTVDLGVRYDPYFPYSERELRFACFQPGAQSTRYANAPAGLTFATDPGCPRTGINAQFNAVAPRVGFAYKLTQDNKTSIRGGVGYYYNAISANAQTSHYNAPFSPVFTFTGIINFQNPFASVGVPNPFPARFGGTALPPANATFVTPTALQVSDSNLKIPLLTTWNLTLERQLGSNWLVRAAYVGNKGTDLANSFQNSRELNPAIYSRGLSTVGNTQARRQFQSFTNIAEVSVSGNNSHYEAFQLTVERHFTRGLSILGTYTRAKTMDDFGWTNPFNRRFDYAKSNDNLPNIFNFSGLWDIPHPAVHNNFADRIIDGWHLTGIVSWRSGFPLTIASGIDNSLTGVGRDRADFVGTDLHAAEVGYGESHGQQVRQFFNTGLFTRNAVGTFGNAGRNILTGPRLFQMNLSVFKTTKINEQASWQLRAEAFNAFNNVNFNNPGTTVGTSSFGIISSAADPRILQFGIKVLF